jgi:hypothetical protein
MDWHAVGERNGVHIKVRFFDGDAAEQVGDRVQRTLCFLPGTTACMLWREQDRRNLRWRSIVAQSDGVFALDGGLLNLEYKSRSRRPLDRQTWLRDVRTKDMLQCLIATVVVAQTQGRVCAAALRYHDAGLLLVPQQRLLDTVFAMVEQACVYYGTNDVASSKLAAFVEPRILQDFPWQDEVSSRAGVHAHEHLFR